MGRHIWIDDVLERARLSVQRLRTVQQKREALAKSSRRDIALSLEKGKIESARIKVEAGQVVDSICA